jgi:hypothetical protein
MSLFPLLIPSVGNVDLWCRNSIVLKPRPMGMHIKCGLTQFPPFEFLPLFPPDSHWETVSLNPG